VLAAPPPPSAAAAPKCLAELVPCVCGGDCCDGLICAFAAQAAYYSYTPGASPADPDGPFCRTRDTADLRRGIVEFGCTAKGVAASEQRAARKRNLAPGESLSAAASPAVTSSTGTAQQQPAADSSNGSSAAAAQRPDAELSALGSEAPAVAAPTGLSQAAGDASDDAYSTIDSPAAMEAYQQEDGPTPIAAVSADSISGSGDWDGFDTGDAIAVDQLSSGGGSDDRRRRRRLAFSARKMLGAA